MTLKTRYTDNNDITLGPVSTTSESLEIAIRQAKKGASQIVADLPEDERTGSIHWEITDEDGKVLHSDEISAE